MIEGADEKNQQLIATYKAENKMLEEAIGTFEKTLIITCIIVYS